MACASEDTGFHSAITRSQCGIGSVGTKVLARHHQHAKRGVEQAGDVAALVDASRLTARSGRRRMPPEYDRTTRSAASEIESLQQFVSNRFRSCWWMP